MGTPVSKAYNFNGLIRLVPSMIAITTNVLQGSGTMGGGGGMDLK